jgi:two-component system chemotaxis response regulator CheY
MALDPSMPVLVVDDYTTMVRIIRNLLAATRLRRYRRCPDGAAALTRCIPSATAW